MWRIRRSRLINSDGAEMFFNILLLHGVLKLNIEIVCLSSEEIMEGNKVEMLN